MPVSSVTVVPSAPMLLHAASPIQPGPFAAETADLREAVATALTAVATSTAILLLVGGEESLVVDAPVASLASYGLPQIATRVRIDNQLIGAVSARGQAPRVRSDRFDGDVAVLALLLAEHQPGIPLAPVTIPSRASKVGLQGVATGLAAAIRALDRPVAVVAAGDLAATLDVDSPGYVVEGAADWDEAVVAAVREVDPDALGELGPDGAERFQARGWAPLTVALSLAKSNGLTFGEVVYLAPKGVGQLVAS